MHADRVVTAKLPGSLASRLDEVACQIDRTKSWIVREAVADWLVEHERRHQLTLEALRDVDEGRTYSQEEILAHFAQRKRQPLGMTDPSKLANPA